MANAPEPATLSFANPKSSTEHLIASRLSLGGSEIGHGEKGGYSPPSHRVMMRSFPAVARYFPSNERAIPRTGPLCERSVRN